MDNLVQSALHHCQKSNSIQERKDILNNLFDLYKQEEIQIIKYLLIGIVANYFPVSDSSDKAVKANVNSKLGTIPFMANVTTYLYRICLKLILVS